MKKHTMHIARGMRTTLGNSIIVLFFALSTSNSFAMPKPESPGTQIKPETEMESSDNPVQTELAPCPDRPNCVNSVRFKDKRHYILPLSIPEIKDKSDKDVLLEVINSFDRITVSEVQEDYIKVAFKSRLMGFVDDVEFLIKDSHTDVRSASRSGYYDFGVNRRRVEKIRERLQALDPEH